jgi:hypothetical protein
MSGADYWVTGVRKSSTGAITHVCVRQDQGATMAAPIAMTRDDAIAWIVNRKSFVTAFERDGKWQRGEDVRAVPMHGRYFLRTDGNNIAADNLDSLPAC